MFTILLLDDSDSDEEVLADLLALGVDVERSRREFRELLDRLVAEAPEINRELTPG